MDPHLTGGMEEPHRLTDADDEAEIVLPMDEDSASGKPSSSAVGLDAAAAASVQQAADEGTGKDLSSKETEDILSMRMDVLLMDAVANAKTELHADLVTIFLVGDQHHLRPTHSSDLPLLWRLRTRSDAVVDKACAPNRIRRRRCRVPRKDRPPHSHTTRSEFNCHMRRHGRGGGGRHRSNARTTRHSARARRSTSKTSRRGARSARASGRSSTSSSAIRPSRCSACR